MNCPIHCFLNLFHDILSFRQELPACYTILYIQVHNMGVQPPCHPPTPSPMGVGLQSGVPPLARGRVDASLKKNISSYLHIPLSH
nr:MAG TPA: hypothetical protein [Caudoviricetes sp.]